MEVKKICLAAGAGIWGLGIVQIVRYVMLGNTAALAAVAILEAMLALAALGAYRGRLPALLLLAGVAAGVCGFFTNHAETTSFNMIYYIQCAFAAAGGIAGTILQLRKKIRPEKGWIPPMAVLLAMLAVFAGFWAVQFWQTRSRQEAGREIWGVPKTFDSTEAAAQGTLEELTYETKAYATDSRKVTKSAWVYLPAGYDEEKEYNILYLMHGTGDDEKYWLITNPKNKVMLDRMIELEVIAPLIVVTPTFYVEDDCMDGLDALTYSFKEELRRDLMPAVESRYATYAETCDEEGFAESRDHRAFAGLSRGAVTTIHSVVCGSLDYFSWFGTFSGSRTDGAYFQEHLQTAEFQELPIHYWYISSGNFDFALPGQIQDYQELLEVEPRLTEGENISFDLYPMRYHSAGNWHISLYNCLQHLFT